MKSTWATRPERFQQFDADPHRIFVLESLGKPFDELAAAVAESDAVLVVVDTLSRFAHAMVKDPSSSTEWTRVMAGLARIARETGAAVLVLHHACKGGGYRDSTAIGAGVDALFEMTAGEDGTTRKIKGRGRWPIQDFSLRLEEDRYVLAGGELTLAARVLLFVESNPGCSMNVLRDGVTGKAETIGRAVSDLIRTGAMEDRGGAGGKRLFALREPPPSESGSHENPQGTATGTACGGDLFPVPMLKGADWEPPVAGVPEAEVLEI